MRLSAKQLERIAKAMLETACRPGEILSLQWMDVNMLQREIIIHAEKSQDTSKPTSAYIAAPL